MTTSKTTRTGSSSKETKTASYKGTGTSSKSTRLASDEGHNSGSSSKKSVSSANHSVSRGSERGFARMAKEDPERLHEIAVKGGQHSHDNYHQRG